MRRKVIWGKLHWSMDGPQPALWCWFPLSSDWSQPPSPGTHTQWQYDSDFLDLIWDQNFEPGERQSPVSGSLLKGLIWWWHMEEKMISSVCFRIVQSSLVHALPCYVDLLNPWTLSTSSSVVRWGLFCFFLSLCIFKAMEVGVNRSECVQTNWWGELSGKVNQAGFELLQGGFQGSFISLVWARRSAAASTGYCGLWGSAGERRAQCMMYRGIAPVRK